MRFLPLLIPFAALLVCTGCDSRSLSQTNQVLQAENDKLRAEAESLLALVSHLKTERDYAREQNAKLREQTSGLSDQLRRMLQGVGSGLDGSMWIVEDDRMIMKQDLAFQLGSDKLSAQGEKGLAELAAMLNKPDNAKAKIVIVGHTCDTRVARKETRDRFTDNWGLSAMRAAAVIRALQKTGVAPARLQGRFHGEYLPRVPNQDKKTKPANRRVEIFLTM